MAANDLANDKKPSWASEVEEDDEATGWSVQQEAGNGGISMPGYPEGPTKPRKNKKKKKNKSNGNMQAKQDSMGKQPYDGEFKNLSIASSQMPGNGSHVTRQDEEVWQVASFRKSKQVSLNHNLPSSTGYISPSTNHGFPTSPGRPSPQSPARKYENTGGHGQRATYSGAASTGFVSGHGEGAGFAGAYGGAQQWRVPDPAPQRSRSFPDGSRFAPQNQSEGSNRKHLTEHAQSQTQVKAWGTPSEHAQSQTQAKAWSTPLPVSAAKEVKRNQEADGSILSQLLPSEREVENLKFASSSTSGNSGPRTNSRVYYPPPEVDDGPVRPDSDSALSDADLDDDSDWIGSDPCDSDASVESLETRKRNKWFQSFFDTLDDFTNEQIVEHDRQWHCPACYGGVGAIDWYRGLQPLISHAKTHRTKRIGLHREFAKVLEEDLERRRAGTGSLAETKFGKWKGLRNDEATRDLMIVWPPMVVIQNTQLELDEQEKWIGMGNKELLDMFSDYSALKARHAYGPQGHRGMSLVIFANSPTGYYNAECLAKNFKDARKGKEHWSQPGKSIFHPGGDRILYGYMATAEDLEIFNKHSSGKSKLKWELKKYHEAVAQPMRQMDEDNQQLHYYKTKVQKQKEHSKILEKSMSMFTRKLELREEEISVIRQRAKEQHEENQKEMDDLERTYKDRIAQLQRSSANREKEIQEKQEEFTQEHKERCQQLEKKLGEEQQPKQAKVEEAIARQTEIVESSLRESEDYEYKKRELLKQQHIKKREFMRRQYEEALEFEKGLEKEKQELLDKYSKNVQSTS
eukprot:c21042_g1_i1 orf=319-2721(-)